MVSKESYKEYKNEALFFAEEKKDDDLDLANNSSSSASFDVNNSSSASFDVNLIEQENIGSYEDDVEDDEKNRVVKFADVEAEKHDAQRDQERSRQELLSKIARLTDTLKEAQEQIQFERDKRKKKEKSLLKLAKELKKRNLVKDQEEDRCAELEVKRKYLEHHWRLAKKELDQEKALHTKLHEEIEKQHEHSVKEEKNKYEQSVTENDNRLADLKKAHMEQCEQLGREVWRANIEADRLHEELTARGLNVPRRLQDGEEYLVVKEKSNVRTFILFLTIVSSIIYAYFGNDARELFTQSGFCTPLLPGTTLDDNSYGIFQAPWWAPVSFKEHAFTAFCTEGGFDLALANKFSPPSSIEWARDGKNNRIVVYSKDRVVLKRSTAKTQITTSKIQFWKRNGQSEELSFDWLSMN